MARQSPKQTPKPAAARSSVPTAKPAPPKGPASPDDPRLAPGSRPLHFPKPAAWLLLMLLCGAVVAMDLALAYRSTDDSLGGIKPGTLPPTLYAAQPYNLLERGLEKGHLYLDKDAPAGLARLSNPYDSDANAAFRVKDGVFDLSYFGGRLYLYFGITPALAAYLPWHLLTHTYLSEWLGVALFSAAGFLASAGFLIALWRRHFPEVGAWYAAAGLAILGTTTTVPLLAARPRFWEVPISCSYAFLMFAVASAWLACTRARRRGAWLALAGLTGALAVGARPNVLPAAVAIAAAAALGAALGDRKGSALRAEALLRPAAAAFVPLIAVGIGLAIYNFERFGDPFQFGQHYQLSSDYVHGRTTFSLAFLPYNLRLYGLSMLRWGSHFPFAWTPDPGALPAGHGIVEFVVGILPNLPVLLLALAAPLAWRSRAGADGRLLAGLGTTLTVLFATQVTILALFYGVCSRYEVDFLPFLALLGCLGLLGSARFLAAAPAWIRRTFAAGLAVLLLYSSGATVCAALAWNEYNRWWSLAARVADGGDLPGALPEYREAVFRSNGNMGLTDLADDELKVGQTREAIDAYTEEVRRNPNDWYGQNNLGVAFMVAKRWKESLRQFRRAEILRPGSIRTECNIGRVLIVLHRPGEATPILQQVLRQDPENAYALLLLGQACLLEGRTEEAVTELRRAHALLPNEAWVEYNLGQALLQAGSKAEAIGHLEAALRLDPGLSGARASLDAIRAQGPGGGSP